MDAPGLEFETWDSVTICFGTHMTNSAVNATEHAQTRSHFTGKERDRTKTASRAGGRFVLQPD
jgi:hypothetical protein